MKKANELAVGTYAIGYGLPEFYRTQKRRARGDGLRANGAEITVFLEGPNPTTDSPEDLKHVAKTIAELGLVGLCSLGVEVVVIRRDKRTDDVKLYDWFTYKNRDGFPDFQEWANNGAYRSHAGGDIAPGGKFPVLIGGAS